MVRGNWASGRRDESSLFCKKIKRLPIEKMCRRQDDIEEGNPHNPYFSLSHKLTSGVITPTIVVKEDMNARCVS